MTNQTPAPITDDIPASLLNDCRALVAEARALAEGFNQWLETHVTLTEKERRCLGSKTVEPWWDARSIARTKRWETHLVCVRLEDLLRKVQDSYYKGDREALAQRMCNQLTALKQAIDALEQAKAAYIKKDRRYKAKASRRAA